MSLDKLNQATYKDVSHPLLSAFVAQAGLSYQSKQQINIATTASRSVIITKKFMNLVRHNYHHLKKPADYAFKLHISVTYLNDTVKKTTNLSTSLIIQKEVLREAQRLLYYTDKSIKEISDLLGYEDEKYFMRIFRKKTGFSPTEYRKHNAPPIDYLF
ncbi:helix-turn-helix domain-containing protein [Flavobacterium ustbae]|uniref:helix-turn-helix domain-containing protein n=1 Tax=Flavobacterium ustbae TaxID=2488790 RepID=UPI000F7A0C70|nr:AraC family transcriptional regulator [Flavobacterium ustbae]